MRTCSQVLPPATTVYRAPLYTTPIRYTTPIMNTSPFVVIGLMLLVVLGLSFVFPSPQEPRTYSHTEQPAPTSTKSISTSSAGRTARPKAVPPDTDIAIIAKNLTIPWDIAFLPDSDLLVTERDGTMLHIGQNGTRTAIEIPGVQHRGEGGLLGIALHPRFGENRWLYLYITEGSENGGTINRADRYTYDGQILADRTTVVSGIPGARFHNGGRIDFGPDGFLYIATGDASQPELAQDLSSLAGKILRVADDGTIPDDNPFPDSLVYSYGHRNPQGLAWDDNGALWSTEHGRSGIRSGFDELNRVVPGRNYGWPDIQGDEHTEANPDAGTVEQFAPDLHSGPSTTWAPASATYWQGSIFFGGLRGSALYEAVLAQDSHQAPTLKTHFAGEFGRIRAVRIGPDGFLYFTTSNQDGRGRAAHDDDKIVRIHPAVLR